MNDKELSRRIQLKELGHLIGSAGSLEQITEAIKKYFYTSTITLTPVGGDKYTVSNATKKIDGCYVIKKGGRFRFEMET